MPYAIEVRGINMALLDDPADFLLYLGVVAYTSQQDTVSGSQRNSLKIVIAVDGIPAVVIIALADLITHVLNLSTRDTTPTSSNSG